MRVFLRAGVLASLVVAVTWAAGSSDSPALYRGERPDLYVQLNGSEGNIAALQRINADVQKMISQGTTPDGLGYYTAHPLHPVNDAGPLATDPSNPAPEAVPIAPAPVATSGAGYSAPTDILQNTSPALQAAYFKGYANLAATEGPGTMGETTLQVSSSGGSSSNSAISYQLDTSFLKSKTVVLSPTSAVLTVSFSGQAQTKDQNQQAETFLESVRNKLLAAIPPLMGVTAALALLAAAVKKQVTAWAQNNGWTNFTVNADVTTVAVPAVTDEETVTIHEQQHALDDQRISLGQSAILPAYLKPGSPFCEVAEALMEVRALLAEINLDPTGETVNVLYGQENASRLANALQSLLPQLLIQAPSLLKMAQEDLAAAETWLSTHVAEYINF